ncbi:MAG: family 78 glycoside hydrolase catalytic domain [Acidobacteria bacterium]|nr:family 78 glycoside hydrolase catalytic domain [Acidobacteriota bacterium]
MSLAVLRRLSCAVVATALCSTLAYATPVRLRTEQRTNPLGIDVTKPRFAWQSDAKSDGWMQSAYELLVASSEKQLKAGKGDVWNSGRVASSDSINIAYGGPALKSRTRYYWAVKVWDNKGKSSVSEPAWFEMGALSPSDWSGKWIYRNDTAAQREANAVHALWAAGVDTKTVKPGTSVEFRYVLHLDKAPERATLHVIARGGYLTKVNGHEAGKHSSCVIGEKAVCNTWWAAFDREQILPYLHYGAGAAGDNEILIESSSINSKPKAPAYPAMAASIRIGYADGTEQRIGTDGKWQARSENGKWQAVQVLGGLSVFEHSEPPRNSTKGTLRVSTDASLLRKDFQLKSTVQSARLRITALGAYRAYLNGKPVAPDTLLSPGFTDFSKRVLYQTYDVTSMLQKGTNTIAAMVGGGWHGSPLLWIGERYYPGPDMLMAQLELTFADGTHRIIGTDNTWQTAQSPILFSEIYGGEDYDARMEKRGWNAPGFKAANWTAASIGTATVGVKVTAQPDLPIATDITLHPISMEAANAAHPVVFDMGQNMVGNIRLHVRGPKGTVVRMRFAERLQDDGSGAIYTDNLRSAAATDFYTLSGDGDETYTPAFTFHGFRYVELEGYPGTPTKASIEGLVYDSLSEPPTIRFKSSSDLLNSMGKLGFWGQRGNFVSIPTDCPQRDERMGWMGDAGVFWRTGTYNFDIASFTHKFMNDITDAQYANGSFTDISPNLLGREVGAPGWADAGVLVPYAAWLQYGDTALLERAWPQMEKYMAFIETANPNHLRKRKLGNNYADWLAPDPHTPKDLIATAYWAIVARDMKEMATALGKTADAQKYDALYNKIADAYRKEYVNADGSVKGNTQTAYVVSLYSNIAPENLRANMTNRLVKDIEAHNNHLTTGFLGTPFLMTVLDDNHRADIAFKLLMQDTYPSWGYMVRKGATTWWERWNGDTGDPSMNSYNHYAFGSVMAWVFERVAGIDTDHTGAGYHHLVIKPHFTDALPTMHTEYDSMYGTVTTDWNKATGKFTVITPPNTTATVTLPDGKTDNVTSGTHIYEVK